MSAPIYASAVCSTFRRNLIEGDGGLARPDAPEMMCRDARCPVHGEPMPVCYCRGEYLCDTHRPPPPPDPPGACVLCHHVGDEPLVVGIDGIKWHESCARD